MILFLIQLTCSVQTSHLVSTCDRLLTRCVQAELVKNLDAYSTEKEQIDMVNKCIIKSKIELRD